MLTTKLEEIATAAVKGSKLKDVKLREDLFADGKGKAKIEASKDPMIAQYSVPFSIALAFFRDPKDPF